MRAIVTLLAVIVLIAIVAVGTGFVKLDGRSGSLPTVSGGSLPTVHADVGKVDVGTKKKEVEVPTVQVQRPQ